MSPFAYSVNQRFPSGPSVIPVGSLLAVESGPGGQELALGTWQKLAALPDPRSTAWHDTADSCGIVRRQVLI
jgi:hypothetical protein